MLKPYALFVLLLAGAVLPGQIVLTDAYFPVVGDTLRYSRAAADVSVDLLTGGANRVWDFGTIASIGDFNVVAAPVPADAPFPGAELILETETNEVAYYSVVNGNFSLVGISGVVDFLPTMDLSAPLNPARPERRAPLTFGESFTTSTINRIAVSTDSLPTPIFEEFGPLLTGVDSVRISSSSERQDFVDGYGTLTINGQTYTVLRERRTEVMDNRVEARLSIIGYTDITGTLASAAPDLADFLGRQPAQTTYYYWAAGEKEAIATVAVDGSGNITGLTFIRGDATNSVGEPFLRQASVKLYPNPASREATFELEGLDPGTYTLRVVNVLGRQVSSETFFPTAGTARVDLDVSRLPRGTYLYSVTNERGRTLTTQRLLVGG
ncbi:T9SS type A sorting domain-containing protein [Lewinella sp. IMCC34183]|uniref:T9SS type A sorting domain-containing protein n=1 Tax=Lewinella sp. IMCC34183 TaxID=2248762 RepID=UPI000E279012|nr:T9SS type A sorting domain-containing protein [Lewinella sp. IMCC34183]